MEIYSVKNRADIPDDFQVIGVDTGNQLFLIAKKGSVNWSKLTLDTINDMIEAAEPLIDTSIDVDIVFQDYSTDYTSKYGREAPLVESLYSNCHSGCTYHGKIVFDQSEFTDDIRELKAMIQNGYSVYINIHKKTTE